MKNNYISVTCAVVVLVTTFMPFGVLAKELKHTEDHEQASDIVTFASAIDKAIQASPRLQVAKSSAGIAQANRQQAAYFPNPELSVEAENVAGQGQYTGTDSAEVTYGISQEIEIGGKRLARKNMANKSLSLAEIELESARLNLIRDVMVAYADVVAAGEQLKLAKEHKKLAAEVLENVTQRVNAAADPLFQKSKADVAYSTSMIALDKAEQEYNVEKQRLSALWGNTNTDFILDSKEFFTISEPDTFEYPNDAIKNNPDYMRMDAEFEKNKSLLDLEKANAVPNPRINVGMRDFRESGDQAFVVGVSLPIPVLNRNQGNIVKAHHEISKTSATRQVERIELANELIRNWQELENSYKQAKTLKSQVIPSAEKAFSLARKGYQAGKFQYLEVLDAQRTLFEAKEQYNSSLKQYHTNQARIDRLTAKYASKQNEENHEIQQ